jgi:hypothetical protein
VFRAPRFVLPALVLRLLGPLRDAGGRRPSGRRLALRVYAGRDVDRELLAARRAAKAERVELMGERRRAHGATPSEKPTD